MFGLSTLLLLTGLATVGSAPIDTINTIDAVELDYTQALLSSLPRLDGTRDKKLQTIEGLPPDLISLPIGCPFAERCTMAREKCLEENPPLEELDSNRRLACWVNIDTGDYR